MRSSGLRGLLIYCADYRCSHYIAISGDRWPDDIRLSDIEPRFVCTACGKRVQTCGRTSHRHEWVSANRNEVGAVPRNPLCVGDV